MVALEIPAKKASLEKRVAIAAYGALIGWVLLAGAGILYLNGGHFVYTLDDPYIHLAMSEGIHAGGYGVNPSEPASASSSILFPYLLAWASPYPFHMYLPLVIDLAALAATVLLFRRFFSEIGFDVSAEGRLYATMLTALIPLATNLVGLAYVGMEHSLQVFLDSLILFGLIRALSRDRIDPWLPAALILAPMIRFESTAVAGAALLVLAARGWRKPAILVGLILAMIFCAFSLYLCSLGLSPIPNSVRARSLLVGNAAIGAGAQSIIISAIVQFLFNLFTAKGMVLMLLLLGMAYSAWRARKRALPISDWLVPVWGLALCGIYLVCGRISVIGRHETSIFTLAILIFIFLARRQILSDLERRSFFKVTAYSLLILAAVGGNFLRSALLIPVASNNIYEQQYQMHRLVTEYLRGPVAVNDIGWVSYRNDFPVLDLWGLASAEALRARRAGYTPESLARLVENSDVRLIMIYDKWFKALPIDSWTRVARLHTSRQPIYAGDSVVSFYAPEGADIGGLRAKLAAFAATLPPGVRLELF